MGEERKVENRRGKEKEGRASNLHRDGVKEERPFLVTRGRAG